MNEDDYRELMEEPPGGGNSGRNARPLLVDADGGEGRSSTSSGSPRDSRWIPLGVEATQAAEFMRDGGFSVVVTNRTTGRGRTYGRKQAGMTAGSRVDAYIDRERLQELVEQGLGFTVEQLGTAYGPGRPSAERLELRTRIDARLLELQRKGGNMLALARVLGWPIREEKGECRVMAAALARARAAEVSA